MKNLRDTLNEIRTMAEERAAVNYSKACIAVKEGVLQYIAEVGAKSKDVMISCSFTDTRFMDCTFRPFLSIYSYDNNVEISYKELGVLIQRFNTILNTIFQDRSFIKVFRKCSNAICYSFGINDYDVDIERKDPTFYSNNSLTKYYYYFSTIRGNYVLHFVGEDEGDDVFYVCNCEAESYEEALIEAISRDFWTGDICNQLAKIAENVGKGVERVGEYFEIKWSSNLKICKVYAKSFGIDFEKSVLLVAKEEGITIKINPNDSDICFSYLAD